MKGGKLYARLNSFILGESMMIIPDMDNLIVETKFFSHSKDTAQLKNSILDAIEKQKVWDISVDRGGYFEFKKNLIQIFSYKKKVKGAKSRSDKFFAALEEVKPSATARIRVSLNETKDGTMVSVICYPVMYLLVTQMDKFKGHKFPLSDIKSAILECQEFTLSIFSGLLGYETTDPPHPRKPVEPKSYEFLKNTKEKKELTEKIKSALQNANKEVYLCGWIGQAIVPILRTLISRGITLKIITKTPSEGTSGKGYRDKAAAFEQLKDLNKEGIRLVPTCHGRFLIIDDDNISVGSMDMDSESFDQREECAIWSNDPSLVIRAKVCFENLFKKGKHVG